MLNEWLSRLRFFVSGRKRAEVDEEFQFHLDREIEANVAAGMSAEEARRRAAISFGSQERAREECRESRPSFFLESLGRDARFALRHLRKSPGFAITAVLTLALGIGANTAIFSIVNAVLRHPAGVDQPREVAVLHTRYAKFALDIPYVSTPTDTTALSLHGLVDTAALMQGASFTIVNNGGTEHIAAARVSSQWFQVYGALPILGRTFTVDEDTPNAGPVVVLSYGFWHQAFGGRSDAVGQMLMLGQTHYRVIGVMRSDFAWPRQYKIWVPIALPPAAFAPEHAFDENYEAVVRLRPGVSVQQLNAALSATMWDELRRGGGDKYAKGSGWSVYATPLTEFAAGPLRTPLYLLSAVVALVLLIAAANVAGLFLARASVRNREFAIRRALGASAGRMIRQIFVETSLLAAGACVVGIVAGPVTGRVLLRLVPHDLAAGFAVHLAPAVLVFVAGAAVLTVLLAGMGPAIALLRQSHRMDLHEGGRQGTASIDKQRLRRAFVIGEVATAFLLLAGTGLFLASLRKLQQVDPRFNPRGVLTGEAQYAGHDFLQSQPQQAAFVGGVVSQLAAQPGVTAAAAVEPLPFTPDAAESCSFAIIGRPVEPGDPGPHSGLTLATPGYLRAMQIPLLAGRWFNTGDLADTQRVAVVDERLAQRYWPGASPIGQHISFDCDEAKNPAVVVGVVATIRQSSLEEDTSDGMRYYPFAQGQDNTADFVVRTAGEPIGMAAAMKRAVSAVNSAQAVTAITPMETLIQDSLAGRRLIAWMLAAFGVLALLLTVVGVYGLISYVTALRTNEVGVRMALGAKRGDVLRLVLSNTLALVGIGLLIGTAASIVASVLLQHIFADFGAGTLSSLGLAALALLLAGALAGLLPALRAASVDPTRALRAE